MVKIQPIKSLYIDMKARFIVILFLVGCLVRIHASDFVTLNYLHTSGDSLDLDLFLPQNTSNQKVPLVIFVHGGGFSGGDRPGGHSLGKYLAQNGIASATITYTLYMKNKDFGCNGVLTEKVKAIRYAVTDLWEATNFLIEKAEKYQLDTRQIYIVGTSAGAETVLHAAYWPANMALFGNGLPTGFRYAGIVSGAGAIMDLNLIHKENAIPTMFIHGDKDPVVPYATAPHHSCPCDASGWLMLFGSKSMYEHMVDIKANVILYTFIGKDHSVAGNYLYDHQEPVLKFIRKVQSGKKFRKHVQIK